MLVRVVGPLWPAVLCICTCTYNIFICACVFIHAFCAHVHALAAGAVAAALSTCCCCPSLTMLARALFLAASPRRNAMPCHATLCYAMLNHAVPYHVSCLAMLCASCLASPCRAAGLVHHLLRRLRLVRARVRAVVQVARRIVGEHRRLQCRHRVHQRGVHQGRCHAYVVCRSRSLLRRASYPTRATTQRSCAADMPSSTRN